MKPGLDALFYFAAIVASFIASGFSVYVSNRLLRMKEDILKEAREEFAAKPLFERHESEDDKHHDEVRSDLAKVEARVDRLAGLR